MPVGLVVGDSFYEIGTSDLLNAFFSTISHNLEPNGWGSVYPLVMQELFQGSLKWKRSETVIENLQQIRECLKQFSPDKVVWNIENLTKRPPWGDDIQNPNVIDLSNYFVTDQSYDMFDIFIEALTESMENKKNVDICFFDSF